MLNDLFSAMFVPAESRSQQLLTSVVMAILAAILGVVAWWMLTGYFAAVRDQAEIGHPVSGRRGGPTVLMVGGGAIGLVAVVLALASLASLIRVVVRASDDTPR